ncbi:MAG: V-ATPase subunit C-domain-containing protein, partial [Olpidium bornovanus]
HARTQSSLSGLTPASGSACRRGNLAIRSLDNIVKKEHFVQDSEFLTTLLIAVRRQDEGRWLATYEKGLVAELVVPRSSQKLAEDSEYAIFNVTLFQRVVNEFTNRCKEEKFVIRDFKYDEQQLDATKKAMQELGKDEKEMWVSEPSRAEHPPLLPPSRPVSVTTNATTTEILAPPASPFPLLRDFLDVPADNHPPLGQNQFWRSVLVLGSPESVAGFRRGPPPVRPAAKFPLGYHQEITLRSRYCGWPTAQAETRAEGEARAEQRVRKGAGKGRHARHGRTGGAGSRGVRVIPRQ